MQSYGTEGAFKKVGGGVFEMIRRSGVFSLWKGLPPTLWRDVPFSGIYWCALDCVRQHLIPVVRLKVKSESATIVTASFASSVFASALAATLTTPFDVIKTRRQTASSRGATLPGGGKASTVRLLRELYLAEGVAGLTIGMQARIAKCVSSCAVMLTSYEVAKLFF